MQSTSLTEGAAAMSISDMSDKSDICLIRGPYVLAPGVPSGTPHAPPIGMASLAAYLRQQNFSVSVIDGYGAAYENLLDHGIYRTEGLSAAQIADRIPATCRIAGISCMFSNTWHYHNIVIREIRSRRPDITIIMGGEHATALPGYCLKTTPELDYVLVGEGETAFAEFAHWVLSGKNQPVDTLPNIFWRDGDEIRENKRVKRIKDLNALPYPAWDLFPIERYLSRGASCCYFSKKNLRAMPMIASRGCPYSCKFCTCRNMWESRYYCRSAENIIGEIRTMIDLYQVNHIDFFDMTFAMNRAHLSELCRRLDEENFGITWDISNTRVEILDDEMIAKLQRSGCRHIPFAVESGSNASLKHMNKKLDSRMMQKRIRSVVKSGMQASANLILGLPDERHVDVWQTLLRGWQMAWNGVSGIMFLKFMPYPGSEYYDRLRKEGWFPDDPEAFNRMLVLIVVSARSNYRSCTRHISRLALFLYGVVGMSMCYLLFFLRRPALFYRHVRNVWNHELDTNYDHIVSGIVRLLLPGRK